MQLLSSMLAIVVITSLTSVPSIRQVAVTDDLNRSIVFEQAATRIVSLAPSITETLFALGVGNRIVGVTDYCNYPAEAPTKPHVGSMLSPSIETIVGLEPDLVVMSMEGNTREAFDLLDNLGVRVFVTNPRTLDGIYKSIINLGILTGATDEAGELVHKMKQREDLLRAGVTQKTKTMMIVSLQPLLVVGADTFLAELLSIAGGENVAAETGLTYPAYSRESVIATNPDVILLTSGLLGSPDDLVSLYPEWQRLTAVKDKRVFVVDSDIVSRPGPRAIDGLEAIQAFLKAATTKE